MSTAKAIYELAKTLPEDKAYMVLKFAEFLHQEIQFSRGKQSNSDWSADFFALYGSCTDNEFDVDNEGISDAMDDDLVGVFDE